MPWKRSPWIVLDNENVFWEGYCEIQGTKDSASSWTEQIAQQWQQLFLPPDENESKIRMHFLKKTESVTVAALVVDLIGSAVVTLGPSLRRLKGESPIHYKSHNPLSLYCGTWLIYVCLALSYYLVLHLDRRKALFQFFSVTPIQAMDALGQCLLMGRLLVLLQVLSLYFHGGDTCMETDLLDPADSAFDIILVRMVIDALQVCVFALLPFPRVYILMLSVLEGVAQSARLLTCSARLGLGSGFNDFIWSIAFPIPLIYIVIIVIPAFTFSQTVRASYAYMLRLKEASEEQKALVNMFCCDLKLPVQQAKQLLVESHSDCAVLGGGMASISMVVDHIVFLMRLHERRFSYSYEDTIALPDIVNSVIKGLQYSTGMSNCFDLDIAQASVLSNRNCLSVLLFYAINAALVRLAFDMNKLDAKTSTRSTDDGERAIQRVAVTVMLRKVGKATMLFCTVCYSKASSAEAKAPEITGTPSKQKLTGKEALDHYQTCLMFCAQVAAACHGTFSQNAQDGMICFRIPVEQHVGTLEPLVVAPQGMKLTSAVVKEMCIYSADPSLSDLAVQALQSIIHVQYHEYLPVFAILNMVDMHIRSVVIVTSLQACAELRRKQYTGIIVLLSDRLGYLDKKDRILFDFALPIPPSSLELEELAKWLNSKVTASTIGVTSSAQAPSQHYQTLWQYLAAIVNACRAVCFFVPSVPGNLNYLRWWLLNPNRLLFHHTNYYEVTVLLITAVLVLVFALFNFERPQSVMGMLSYYVVIGMRCIPTKKLVAKPKVFWYGLHLLFGLMIILSVFNCLGLFTDLASGNPGQSADIHKADNMRSFLRHLYGGNLTGNRMSGERVIINVVLSVFHGRNLCGLMVWPYGVIAAAFQFLYAVLTVQRFLAPLLDKNIVTFIECSLVVMHGFVIAVGIYTEKLRREEFLEQREFILSRDFLERSIASCWRDSLLPLTSLAAMQESMLEDICEEAIQAEKKAVAESEPITTSQQHEMHFTRMDSIRMNILLSKELLSEMQMSLKAAVPRDSVELIHSMDVYLLQPIVRQIAASFLSKSEDLTIRFSVQVHPTLLLVRCDKAMLEALLCSACRNAVGRIRSSLSQQHPHAQVVEKLAPLHPWSRVSMSPRAPTATNGGKIHEVMLTLLPCPGQEHLRFSDIHTMHLLVHDTAIVLQGAQHCFMKNIYERFMSQHGQQVQYEVQVINGQVFRHCQRITLPYKLCPSTPKVASLFPAMQPRRQAVDKLHMRYFQEYQQAKLIGRRLRPNRRFQHTHLLTMVCHEKNKHHIRGGEMIGSYDCSRYGFDVKPCYLKTSAMPSLEVLQDTFCFLIDQDLCVGNKASRQYLHELILYLRAHDFIGVIALGVPRCHREEESDFSDHDKHHQAHLSAFDTSPTTSRKISGLYESVKDSMEAEIVLEYPLDGLSMQELRKFCDRRLMDLIFPAWS